MNWTTRWTPPAELARDLATVTRQQDGDLCPRLEQLTKNGKVEQARLQLFEITCRVARGRYLLRAGKLNRLAHGCLAVAQLLVPEIQIVAYVVLSGHYHLLVIAPDAPRLARFMNHFQSQLAREANRVHGWSSRFWHRRYNATLVSDEPQIQFERLRYLLSQGCKENLVASPLDWPGATSHAALASGHRTIQGDWIDRTELCKRRKAGERGLTERDATRRVDVQLAKLPAFEHLSWRQYGSIVRDEIRAIERETRERHRQEGTKPLGAEKVLTTHPHTLPAELERSPRPRFHASKEIFKILCEAYRAFLNAYGAAVDRLREGKSARFPAGCFPPALPPRLVADSAVARAPT